jgi:hypothetical protein
MTEQEQVALTAAFGVWFKGNQAAMRLAAHLTEAAHFIDDLIDGDFVPPASARRCARLMLLEIPSNVFYRGNYEFLQPLLAQCWLQWLASDQMEREPQPEDRPKCYMLRASLYGLFHGMAVIVGGLDWAEEIGPEIYRTYGEKLEDFDHA